MIDILKGVKIGLISLFRDRLSFFWNTIFPIFIVTLMVLSFKDIGKSFEKIDVGMKSTNPYYEISKNIPYINIKNTSDYILSDLVEKKYIAFVNDDLSVDIVKNSSKVMVVKNIFENIKQISKTKLDREEIVKNFDKNFIDYSKQEIDNINIILFSIIIMTSMYTAFMSVEITQNIMISENAVAIRLLTSPIKKYKYLTQGVISSIIIGMLNVSILLFHLKFILKIDLIKNYPLTYFVIFITMLFASVMGIFFSLYVIGNYGFKSSVVLATIMIMTQFSGMLGTSLSKTINSNLKIFYKINPALYLTNSLIYVNKITNTQNFKFGIFYILSITFILFLLSVIKLRRVCNDF